MTHPFHPWLGREFVFVAARQTWGEDRVCFFDDDGVQRSLPRGWTDAGDVDAFVALAAGRSALRVADLLELVELLERLRRLAPNAGGRGSSPSRSTLSVRAPRRVRRAALGSAPSGSGTRSGRRCCGGRARRGSAADAVGGVDRAADQAVEFLARAVRRRFVKAARRAPRAR